MAKRRESYRVRIIEWIFPLTVMFALKNEKCVSEEIENEKCKLLIPNDYRKIYPPPNDGVPVSIYTSFGVLDIDEINEGTMDFRLNTYIAQSWNDSRLSPGLSSDDYILDDCYKYIWIPDTIYESAKKVHDFGSVYFYVMSDGSLYYSTRLSFKVGCLMNFKLYPFDTQNCMFLVSFMQTANSEALLKWKDDPASPYKSKWAAIEMLKHVEPLQFELLKPTVETKLVEFPLENFTYLVANFTFVRRVTGSIVNIYAPSALIVAVSWVTFWINVDAAPARVALSVTSLLTLCTQVTQYKSQLPPVNYLTAMDIWLFACIVMVFSTLLEFAISYNKYTLVKQAVKTKAIVQISREKSFSNYRQTLKKNSWVNSERNSTDEHSSSVNCCMTNGVCTLDVVCRKLYPISFTLFIVIYWIYFSKFS